MNYQYIHYEKTDRIVQVTLNRPEARNALTREAHVELHHAFERFANDPAARVAILTGSGDRAFCAGNDLKATAARHRGGAGAAPPPVLPAVPFGGITGDVRRRKPIIGAVNGAAYGGGFELALACDLVVCADHATFALPEPRWGLIAAAGGLHRLPRQLPLKVAMGLILTGEPITAAQALAYGLVNEVVALEDLLPAARRLAGLIEAGSPVSIEVSMLAVAEGADLPLEDAMGGDANRIAELKRFEDFYEGPRAFAQRRKPSWTGRPVEAPAQAPSAQ